MKDQLIRPDQVLRDGLDTNNPRQFLALPEANLGYDTEICPCHQMLAWCGVYAREKPFMRLTPGLRWENFYSYLKTSNHNQT